MALLAVADPATYPSLKAVFDAFSDRIDQRGDFLALMLAFPFVTDPARREVYRARAMTAMVCTFPEALAFADATGGIGETEEARRWLTIATHLAGQDSWQLVDLADSYRTLLGTNGETTALALYETAHDLGSRTAVQRLLRINGSPSTAGYDQEKAVMLYTDLVALSSADEIPVVLARTNRVMSMTRPAAAGARETEQTIVVSPQREVAGRDFRRP